MPIILCTHNMLLLLVLWELIIYIYIYSLFLLYSTYITSDSRPLYILILYMLIIPIRFKINLSSGSTNKSIKGGWVYRTVSGNVKFLLFSQFSFLLKIRGIDRCV